LMFFLAAARCAVLIRRVRTCSRDRAYARPKAQRNLPQDPVGFTVKRLQDSAQVSVGFTAKGLENLAHGFSPCAST
jgi:hypothetical protein